MSEPDLSPRTLVDELLAEQRRLTAVERFARKYERGDVPAQARYYRDLIPASSPAPGQQYAFAVDLDACTGCKACVSACHSLNGLEEHETWRSVGQIHGGNAETPYQQTVTTACHHCLEPACLEGCPVGAYEKEDATGVVRHLDDQCIGCQYCVLKCPYDVPKYSERLGIVRKCDMCIGRLSEHEAPACVQACPHEAISIQLVDRSEIAASSSSGTSMLPGAFESSYTKPTTRFTSRRSIPENSQAADADELKLEHAHWSLIFMLLLTQTAAGLFGVVTIASISMAAAPVLRTLSSAGWLLLHLGLSVSVLHLGRPLGAWRFFLGLRTSWMSREILAFGIFSFLATVTTALAWLLPYSPSQVTLAVFTTFVAGASVFTSAMIYVDTHRPFWCGALTIPKFFGSVLLMGSTTAAALMAMLGTASTAARIAAVTALVVRTGLHLWNVRTVTRAKRDPAHPAHRSQLIIERFHPSLPSLRSGLFFISSLAGGIAIGTGSISAAVVAFVSTFAAQVLERYSFFAACPAPRMPGGVPS